MSQHYQGHCLHSRIRPGLAIDLQRAPAVSINLSISSFVVTKIVPFFYFVFTNQTVDIETAEEDEDDTGDDDTGEEDEPEEGE